MTFTIKDGKVQFDIAEFVSALSGEDRKLVAKLVAFDEYLMQAICETVATGVCFEDAWWSDTTGINKDGSFEDQLRMKLLPMMPEAARRQIKRLYARVLYYERENRRISDAAWKLWHSVQEYAGRSCDWVPPFERSPEPTGEQLEACLKEAGLTLN